MGRLSVTVIVLCGLFGSGAALAGGSDVPVRVIAFSASADSDYTLVVEPVTPAKPDAFPDPYLGHCPRFTVVGTYSRLAGFALSQPPMVTHNAHVEAVRYLRDAAASRATIRLGWMGEGFFIPDSTQPCVVNSRALLLLKGGSGTAVVSFYHAI